MQNRLIIIKRYCWLCFLVIVACCNSNNDKGNPGKELPYRMYVVENEKKPGGLGYIIEFNRHLVIRQFTIPALEGEQLFNSKTEAEKVGKLVTSKLNQSLRPSVTKKELAALGIIKSSTDEKKK